MSERYIISEEDCNVYTLEEGALVAFPWRTALPGDELPAGGVELGRAHGRVRWLDPEEGYEVDWARGVLEEGSADWNRIKGIEARLRVEVLARRLERIEPIARAWAGRNEDARAILEVIGGAGDE